MQRRSVALKRINDPAAYPNDLVTRVSAVEAYARSLLSHLGAKSVKDVHENYKKHSKSEAPVLVQGDVPFVVEPCRMTAPHS